MKLFNPRVGAFSLLLAALTVATALAQPGTDPAVCGTCTTPAATRTFLRQEWYTNISRSISSYTTSRARMYTNIFVFGGKVTCVYTGFQMNQGTGSNLDPINCEHTIPQSYFSEAEPMKSDIHHLYPTHGSVNSARSNYPVGNVPDVEAETWYTAISNTYTTRTTPPSSNPQLYSKLNSGGANAQLFEPRDDHKGDIARSIFYFYTVYPNTAGGTGAGGIRRVADPAVLYQWHLQDPVDQKEIDKNNRIASFQNTRNFFIDFPASVLQAWGDEIGSVAATITTTLPKTSFFVNEAFTLTYSASGSYSAGNTFTAQLSDDAGSFASPTVLGSATRTTSGSITCTIPASVTSASPNYRIRVVSSTPPVTGDQTAAVNIQLTAPATTIALGSLGFTTIEQGSAFSVPFTTTGIFNPGNAFTVYIKGSMFAATEGDGIPVGNLVGTTSGSIACVIPSNLATGSNNYRIRIVASNTGLSNVSYIGAESGTFSVTAPIPASITVADITEAPLNPGQSFEVSYTKTGTFAANNAFSAILSDASGSFAAPRVIGTINLTSDGTINAIVPADVPAGTGYRIQVTGTAPATTSNQTAAFTVNAPTVPVITTGSVSPISITAGSTATVNFVTGGSFTGGNVFSAQLSDASGSFDGSPVTIGTGTSPITVTIPTATAGGTNYRIRVVGSAPATTGTDNGQNLTILANTTTNLPIVVNKYQNNSMADNIELLVIRNNFDARGYIIKDFSANMVNDNGGKLQFSTNTLWSSLPSGTLIVLRVGSSGANDVTVNAGAGDWNLDVGLTNTTYFTNLASGMSMDVAANEIVMIKAPGSGAAGTAGAVHTFANGTGGGSTPSPSNFEQLSQPLLFTTTFTGSTNGFFVIATNPTSSLNDFAGTAAQVQTAAVTFGQANNATNQTYINSLRALSTSVEAPLTLAQRMAVFPNPAVDVVKLMGSASDDQAPAVGTLKLYDLSGRQVGQWAVNRPDGVLDEQINVAALGSGLYLLRLELPQGVAAWKVVKQ